MTDKEIIQIAKTIAHNWFVLYLDFLKELKTNEAKKEKNEKPIQGLGKDVFAKI